ncbi:MAG: universal stress protein [Candidatus Eiseniibacteriota bacterium]
MSGKTRKLLVALDDAESSSRVIEHVAGQIAACPDAEITLLHVDEVPPALAEHGGAESPEEEHEKQQRQDADRQAWRRETAARLDRELFGPARERLRRAAGGDRAAVNVKLVTESETDAARTIVDEARGGGYDIVVLGRTGKSELRERLLGSTTSSVLDHLECCTLWVV